MRYILDEYCCIHWAEETTRRRCYRHRLFDTTTDLWLINHSMRHHFHWRACINYSTGLFWSNQRKKLIIHHRLRGSASPVLTATHHSYGSPRLSDFFPSRLWGQTPQRTFTQNGSNDVFTKGCAFCSKSRYFSYPLISRPPKRSKFCKFLDLEIIFHSIWPLTLEVRERTPLILHQSSMKVT